AAGWVDHRLARRPRRTERLTRLAVKPLRTARLDNQEPVRPMTQRRRTAQVLEDRRAEFPIRPEPVLPALARTDGGVGVEADRRATGQLRVSHQLPEVEPGPGAAVARARIDGVVQRDDHAVTGVGP